MPYIRWYFSLNVWFLSSSQNPTALVWVSVLKTYLVPKLRKINFNLNGGGKGMKSHRTGEEGTENEREKEECIIKITSFCLKPYWTVCWLIYTRWFIDRVHKDYIQLWNVHCVKLSNSLGKKKKKSTLWIFFLCHLFKKIHKKICIVVLIHEWLKYKVLCYHSEKTECQT